MKQNYVDILVPVATPSSKPGFEPLEWAKKNCPGYITNDAVQKQGKYYYRFFFNNEHDCMFFALKWAG